MASDKSFDDHHYEGPVAFANLDCGLSNLVADLNELDGTTPRTGWRIVPVTITRASAPSEVEA